MSSAVNALADIHGICSSLGAQLIPSRTVHVISVGVTCQSVISRPFQYLSGIAPISLKSHSPLPRGPYFSKSPIIGVSWISEVYHVRPPFWSAGSGLTGLLPARGVKVKVPP